MSSLTPPSDTCASLHNPSSLNFTISILILLGILISYLPQHHRLLTRRTSYGLSPYYVLLGTTSGTSAFANILNIENTRHAVRCCSSVSGYECAASLLGVAQIGVQWACFVVILFLFLIFFPRNPNPSTTTTTSLPPAKPHPPTHTYTPSATDPSYTLALLITILSTLHILILFALTAILPPHQHPPFANLLGVTATLLATLQFLPQLYTTWRLGTVGSLSIPTMCIQTPGSFLWVASLAARLGWGGWSTWGVYAVTGVLQGGLLGMGITFEIKRRRREGEIDNGGHGEGNGHVDEVEEGDDHERTRLVGNER